MKNLLNTGKLSDYTNIDSPTDIDDKKLWKNPMCDTCQFYDSDTNQCSRTHEDRYLKLAENCKYYFD